MIGSGRWTERLGTVRSRVLQLMLITVAATACGDLTSGGVGEVEVLVAADSLNAATASAGPLELMGMMSQFEGPAGVGTLEEAQIDVGVRVFLRRGLRDWVEVTDGPQQVTLSVQGLEPIEIARREVRDGQYTAVRAEFRQIEARNILLDGERIDGPVRVELGADQRLTYVRPFELEVVDGEMASVAIELRSGRWIPRLDRDQRRVLAEDFEESFRVRQRH